SLATTSAIGSAAAGEPPINRLLLHRRDQWQDPAYRGLTRRSAKLEQTSDYGSRGLATKRQPFRSRRSARITNKNRVGCKRDQRLMNVFPDWRIGARKPEIHVAQV